MEGSFFHLWHITITGCPPGSASSNFSTHVQCGRQCLYFSFHYQRVVYAERGNQDREQSWFESLTPEQQKALVETGYEAGVFNNELQSKAEEHYLGLMKAEGVTAVVPGEEVLKGFREKAQDFYKQGASFGWSDGLYERVKDAMK